MLITLSPIRRSVSERRIRADTKRCSFKPAGIPAVDTITEKGKKTEMALLSEICDFMRDRIKADSLGIDKKPALAESQGLGSG
jgi:hypothetical protein